MPKILNLPEKEIIELYKGGMNGPELAEKFGCSFSTIYRIMARHNEDCRTAGESNRVSLPEKEIIELYKNEMNGYELAEKYNCHHQTIYDIMDRHGEDRRRPGAKRKWFYNNQFAAKTKASAYWAGALASDGCVSDLKTQQDSTRLGLSKKDLPWLIKFQSFMEAEDLKIGHCNQKVQLALCSDKLAKDLLDWNITPRKTFTLKGPCLPEELLPHYIRGVIDGDGGVYNNSTAKKPVKNPASQIKITTASKDFANWLMGNCRFNPKLCIDTREKNPVYNIYWSSFADVSNVCNWIYKDSKFETRMTRKHDIWKELEAISKKYEEQQEKMLKEKYKNVTKKERHVRLRRGYSP